MNDSAASDLSQSFGIKALDDSKFKKSTARIPKSQQKWWIWNAEEWFILNWWFFLIFYGANEANTIKLNNKNPLKIACILFLIFF